MKACEVELDGLGTLHNPVVDQAAAGAHTTRYATA